MGRFSSSFKPGNSRPEPGICWSCSSMGTFILSICSLTSWFFSHLGDPTSITAAFLSTLSTTTTLSSSGEGPPSPVCQSASGSPSVVVLRVPEKSSKNHCRKNNLSPSFGLSSSSVNQSLPAGLCAPPSAAKLQSPIPPLPALRSQSPSSPQSKG